MEQDYEFREDIFVCQCHDVSHQLVFSSIIENGSAEVYVSTHLSPGPWYERLKIGLKYIFGHRSKYGDFDEFIFHPKDADKLQHIVDLLKKNKDE